MSYPHTFAAQVSLLICHYSFNYNNSLDGKLSCKIEAAKTYKYSNMILTTTSNGFQFCQKHQSKYQVKPNPSWYYITAHCIFCDLLIYRWIFIQSSILVNIINKFNDSHRARGSNEKLVAIPKLAWRKTWTSNQLNSSSEAYSVYPKTRPANLKLHSALIIHRQDEYRFICGLSVSLFLNIYVYLNTWWIKFILFNVSHLLTST